MAATIHPAYQQAGEHRRWGGRLAELLPALRPEAWKLGADEKTAAGRWAWRVLPGGAVVSLRIRGDMDLRRELRISRGERPETEAARGRWEQELSTFLKHFGVTEVSKTPATAPGGFFCRLPADPKDTERGGVAVRWIELRKGETSPGKALCYRCREAGRAVAVEWFPPAGLSQVCNFHIGEETRAAAEARRQSQRAAQQTAPSSPGGRESSRSSTSRPPASTPARPGSSPRRSSSSCRTATPSLVAS